MFIDKNSLIINGINMGSYVLQVNYGYNKLWASDSGRNLAGVQSGTLIGIFPKLIVQFKRLSQTELETIAPILDSANQTVQYYDPVKKAKISMTTYTGDWEMVNKRINGNESFEISFIAVRKRG